MSLYIGVIDYYSIYTVGMSFIITKKGLQDSSNKAGDNYSASDKLLYLKNPIWWAGMATSAYTLLYG